MNAPSKDIKDILIADSSLGLTYLTDLFIGVEPTVKASQADVVTIFDTSTQAPEILLDGAGDYDYTSVQIRVRDTDYMTGWALIDSIKTSLHGRAQETWNGTLYSVIYCSSGPAFLDRDENNKPRFIINFNIQRR